MSENPVHKNREKFNKPSTHRDRKKDQKRGYKKHKNKIKDDHDNPRKPSHCYIDADMPLFMAASAGESVKYRYYHNDDLIAEFNSAADGKHWLESIEVFEMDMDYGFEGDVEELERRVDYEIGSFKKCKDSFERIVKDWASQSGCDNYIAYVSKGSGAKNFRYDVATIKPYKDGRDEAHKPHYLEDLRKWAHSLDYCKKAVNKVEVDDVTCAMAQRKGQDGVIIAGDKDAKQCSGCWILIPDEMEEPLYSDPRIVGEVWREGKKVYGYGWLFLLYQVLAGDDADNYGGCKGIGNAKAVDVLSPFNKASVDQLEEIVKEVQKVFEKTYENGYHYTNHHTGEDVTVSGTDVMIEMLHLAYMLKHKDDVCPLIEILEENN